MKLKTKSIYDKKERLDGARILVTRFYPRGVKRTHFDLWLRGASPETSLLKDYRNKLINWREFSKRFRNQMRTSPLSKVALDQIAQLAKKQTVTLLCYEKEGERCHRQVLKALLSHKTSQYSASRAYP